HLALDLLEEVVEAVALGDVESHAQRAASELARRLLGQGSIDISDDHARALGDQRRGGGPPDAPASAGDGDDLAGERSLSLGHVLPPRACFGGCAEGTGAAASASGDWLIGQSITRISLIHGLFPL